MSTEIPEIVRRAMIETVTDTGQLLNSEIYQLNKYVKRGWLSRGKGGPFPILKTVYAHRDYDFDTARQAYVDEAMAAYEIEKRLRASGYFDVNSPNYGVDLNEQQRKDDEQMSTTTECRIDQLGCVLHGFRDPECKFFNYEHEPPAPRAGERDKWRAFKHHVLNAASLLVAEAKTEEEAAQITTEHNQYATLIGQRDRLLAALRKLAAFDDAGGNMVLRKQGDYSGFDEPGAVRLARELLATIEREGV